MPGLITKPTLEKAGGGLTTAALAMVGCFLVGTMGNRTDEAPRNGVGLRGLDGGLAGDGEVILDPLEGLFADSTNVHDVFDLLEWAVSSAVVHNALSFGGSDKRQGC